jgi:hypothetical protein
MVSTEMTAISVRDEPATRGDPFGRPNRAQARPVAPTMVAPRAEVDR